MSDSAVDRGAYEELLRLMYQQNMLMTNQSTLLFNLQTMQQSSMSRPMNSGGYPGPFGFQIGQMPQWMGGLGLAGSAALMFASPVIGGAMQSAGYEGGPMLGRYNWYDQLRNMQQYEQMIAATRAAESSSIQSAGALAARMIAAGQPGMTPSQFAGLQANATTAAGRVFGAIRPFAEMMMATPGGLQQMESFGLDWLMGPQMVGAHAYLANRTARNAAGGYGLSAAELQPFTQGFVNYFTDNLQAPAGVLSRTRGFSLGDLGSIYETSNRVGLTGGPGGGPGPDDYAKVSKMARALELVADIAAPGASIDQLFNQLERLVGSPLTSVGPQRAEEIVRRMRETSRLTTVPLETMAGISEGFRSFGGQLGLPGSLGASVAEFSLLAGMELRNRGLWRTPSAMIPTPEEAVDLLGRNTMSGLGSDTITVAANLRRMQGQGMALPASLQSALDDLRSGDPRRIAGSWSRLNPMFAASEIVGAYGGNMQTLAGGLLDRSLAVDNLAEFSSVAVANQLGGMIARNGPALSWIAQDAGLPGSAGVDLVFAYQQDPKNGVSNFLANRLFGRSLDQLTPAEQAKVAASATGVLGGLNPIISQTFMGGLKSFFSLANVGSLQQRVDAQTSMNLLYGDTFFEGKLPFGGRLLNELSQLNANNASLPDIVAGILGQGPTGVAFLNASNEEVNNLITQYGVNANDSAGVAKSRRMIGYELGSKWLNMLGDPKTSGEAKQNIKKWFTGSSGEHFMSLILTAQFMNELDGASTPEARAQVLEKHKAMLTNLRDAGMDLGGDGRTSPLAAQSVTDRVRSAITQWAGLELTMPAPGSGLITDQHISQMTDLLSNTYSAIYDASGEVRSDLLAGQKLSTDQVNALKQNRAQFQSLIRRLSGREGDVSETLKSTKAFLGSTMRMIGAAVNIPERSFDDLQSLPGVRQGIVRPPGADFVGPLSVEQVMASGRRSSGQSAAANREQLGATTMNPLYMVLTNFKELAQEIFALLPKSAGGPQ